jgi:hypothetical protein
MIFNEQRVPKITFVLVLTYYVKLHLFVILTAIAWFIVNIQSDLFWHRCLGRQAFGTPRMYTLSPSKSYIFYFWVLVFTRFYFNLYIPTELQISCVFAFFTLWKRVKTHDFQRTTCSQNYFRFSSYLLRKTAFICNIDRDWMIYRKHPIRFLLTSMLRKASFRFAFFTLWKRVKTHVLSDQSVHIAHTYCCVSKLSKFGAYLYSRVHNNNFFVFEKFPVITSLNTFRLVARLFMFLLIFNEQRVPKITFVLVLTYYVKLHLFVILTAIIKQRYTFHLHPAFIE